MVKLNVILSLVPQGQILGLATFKINLRAALIYTT